MREIGASFLALAMGLLGWACFRQDQEETQPQEPETTIERLEAKVESLKWKARLGTALVDKYIEPLDRWLQAPGVVEPIVLDKERFYALGIVPSNRLQLSIWVKFSLFYEGEKLTYGEQLTEDPKWYIQRKTDLAKHELVERLILAYQLGNTDAIETITFGTAHLIRLATGDSVPQNFRNGDVIYRSE